MPTRDLIGTRALYRYSETTVYEHIYLNTGWYSYQCLKGLRRGGAGICLDGFGSGSASFDYLRAVSVDSVKIDGRYIRELTQPGSRNGVLVRHLSGLCRELKITSIAQMVETPQTVATLRQIGVDCGQGFLFGRPEPSPMPVQRVSPKTAAAR